MNQPTKPATPPGAGPARPLTEEEKSIPSTAKGACYPSGWSMAPGYNTPGRRTSLVKPPSKW